MRDIIARRPQAIAVKARADEFAVRERHRSRTIPRFHEAGMKFVERAAFRVHALVIFPRFGNHHHHRVRQFAAREREEFNAIVELRGVAAVGVDYGDDLLQVVAENLAGEQRLTRLHPIDVAAQRVDFAVVGDVTVRMRAIPARERVRRESRVHQRNGRGHGGIPQIVVILFHLLGHQHALVSQRARRQTGNVEPFSTGNLAAVADGLLRDFADDVKFSFKRCLILDCRAAPDKNLRQKRLCCECAFAERGIVHRHIAPAEQRLAFGGNNFGEFGFYRFTFCRIFWQEHLTDAVMADRWKFETKSRRFRHEEIMRHLNQYARAVAGVRFAAARTAMVEVDKDLQGVAHQLVGLLTFHVDDKAQPARIVLELRIIKTLFGRRTKAHRDGLISFRHFFLVNAEWISPRSFIFYLKFSPTQ